MADQKVQEAGGDNSNGGGNEESLQVLPPVNESKGEMKVVFPSETAKDIPSSSSTELKSSELNEGSEQKKEGTEESSQMAEWDDPIALELEKLLIPHIKDACQTAMKKIVQCGYSEEQAEWAVLTSGIYQGYNDIVLNIVNGALSLLRSQKDIDTSKRLLFDGLERLAGYILLEMVSVMKELKPFLTVAEAMWRLLICELNMVRAMEDGSLNQNSSLENPLNCSCCAMNYSQFRNEVAKGTGPQSSQSSHACEFVITGKQSSVQLPGMEGTSSGVSRASLLSAPQASGAGRKGSSVSMKDLLRQKAHHREKGNRGRKGKMLFKTTITTTSVDVTLGKPVMNSQPSHSGVKKNSKGEFFSTLPAVNSMDPAVLKQESKPTVSSAVPGNNGGIPSSVPITEKDEMIASLMLRKQQLQQELQGWTDWTNVKIRQAAQKLSKDKAELKMLRKEKQETDNFEAVMEEKVVKRRSELQDTLSNFNVQMGVNAAALDRLEAERTKLKKGIADSQLKSVQSSIKLQEAKVKEQELLKQCQTLEAETSSLQEDLSALKGEGAILQARLEKARKRQSEFEALRQHEEREKEKFLRKAESVRSEREQLMHQAKVEEDNLRAMAEANRLEFEERKKKLTAEISALKLAAALRDNSGKGGVKREWECIMCLTEAKSVVFLPCAHQVLCTDCNVLHENRGMKDCPSCRTPIMKRINARFPPPRPH